MIMPDAPTLAIIVAVLTGLVSLVLFRTVTSGPSRRTRGRVNSLRNRFGASRNTAQVEETRSLRAGSSASSMPRLEDFIKKLVPRPALLRDRLDRTGKNITILQ